MSMNNVQLSVVSRQLSAKIGCLLLTAFCLLAAGCGVRFDMQDQPRYKAYKKSDFFSDNRASRNLPEGTVARGFLKDDKALHTGKIDNPNLNAPVQTTTDASGSTLVSSFPNDIDEFPVPVTKELVDRGQDDPFARQNFLRTLGPHSVEAELSARGATVVSRKIRSDAGTGRRTCRMVVAWER